MEKTKQDLIIEELQELVHEQAKVVAVLKAPATFEMDKLAVLCSALQTVQSY